MSDESIARDLFYTQTGLNEASALSITEDALAGCDDGELYLEYTQSESFVFDDGRLKKASFDTARGFGLRSVSGESTGYAHASELSEPALRRASETVQAVRRGRSGIMTPPPNGTNQKLYAPDNPLDQVAFDAKVGILESMDAYARSLDERVRQVSASLSGEWSVVEIVRADGKRVRDIRPLMSHRYHLPPSAHTTFLSSRFVVCTFVPRPFETDPRALKVPFFHNNDDYDEVIFYHAGDFFSRDNIHPGMLTYHPAGFTHGPHPKALKRMFRQEKPATDEYAVMIDTRDPLEVTDAASAVEWTGYVHSWKS